MATLDRLSAAFYSRPWKASRCALVNKEKWIKCSYVFPGLAPSKLLLGIGSTGLQLKLFPALQGGLHFYDLQIIQHVQERRTSSRKLELCDVLNCACEQSYVGRTSQRLEKRIKQHIPVSLVKAAESQKGEPKKKGKKKRRKKKKKKKTENQGTASAAGGNQGKNVTLTTEQGDDSAGENDANQQVLKVAKSDSGITRHLKTSRKCRVLVCRSSITPRFKVIARARNASHLGYLEALFIGQYTPELRAQKEFVLTLGLF